MRKTWKAAAATLLDSGRGEWFLHDEAGLKLLTEPRAPKELPVTALIRNAAVAGIDAGRR